MYCTSLSRGSMPECALVQCVLKHPLLLPSFGKCFGQASPPPKFVGIVLFLKEAIKKSVILPNATRTDIPHKKLKTEKNERP